MADSVKRILGAELLHCLVKGTGRCCAAEILNFINNHTAALGRGCCASDADIPSSEVALDARGRARENGYGLV